MKCPNCQTDNREAVIFCEECGARLQIQCPDCQATIPADKKFCGKCGHQLQPISDSFISRKEIQEKPSKSRIKENEPAARPVEGERKHVTVLFSDLSGYTAMSEKLDPEDVKEITGHIFGEIAQIVTKYEGFIEKYIGDAVMAIFGAPVAHEDDPVRAIKAAEEIHDWVSSKSPEVKARTGQSISMHTGINTGLVVTGEIDTGKGTHGIAGDPINFASRLCDLANANEILVGPRTHRQAEGYFIFEALEPAKVKGKAKSVTAYRVLSAKEKPVSRHRLSGLRAELIGRKKEMEKLAEAVKQLRNGKGSVFSIYGDAGTGKSRLVEEFKAALNPDEIQWQEGHAYSYSHNTPYFLLINLLKGAFQIEEKDSPDEIREKIESGVEYVVGKKENVIHSIGSLFSLGRPEVKEVSPDIWKSQLQKAIHAIFLSLTQKAPTIIFLDDLHWADPSSMELLRTIIAEFRNNAVFLCAYRPPFSLFSGNLSDEMKKIYQEIPLRDLSPPEVQNMLQSLLKTTTVPVGLLRLVQEKVEGNPFYLEEVINTLIESDTLLNENGMWILSRSISNIDISSTINGIISARLDRLEKKTKRILQESSVIGRSFLYEILKRITAYNDRLEDSLEKLKLFDLIRVKSLQPDLEYFFKHALTQEVTYNSILRKERQEIHEYIGLVIEDLFRDRLVEFVETLSFHFRRGKSLHKAVDYLMQSGRKSLKRYSVEESHQYYREAYDILIRDDSKTESKNRLLIELLNAWAPVFYYRGSFRELESLLKKHLDLAESQNDKEILGMFYVWLGMSLWGRLNLSESYQYLSNARALGEESGSNRVIGYASAWLPWTCIELGLPHEALLHGEKARQMSDYFDTEYNPFYQSLDCDGYAYWVLGDSGKVRERGKALFELGEKNCSIRGVTWGYYVEGWSYMATGDFSTAIRCLEKAVSSSADPFYTQFPKLSLGMSYVSAEQYDKARETLEEVLRYAQTLGCEVLGTASQAFLAVALIAGGQFRRGIKMLEAAQQQFLKNNARWRYCFTELILAEIFLSIALRKSPISLSIMARNLAFLVRNVPFAGRKAERHYNRAIESAKSICAKGVQGQAYLGLGNLYFNEGKKDKALECMTSATQMFEMCEAEIFLKLTEETRSAMS